MNVLPAAESPQSLAAVCERVRRILAASAEFRALPPGRQDKLTRDMVRAGAAAAGALARRRAGDPAALEEPAGPANPAVEPPANGLVESVDFPTFVSGLIQGTFEAIVDASIRQMSAYTELLRNVAKSVDEFMNDNVMDEHGSDKGVTGAEKVDRRRLAAQRQQLLATVVLMGINRIVVTDGKISASVIYELKPR
jgi:hypothetical protein